MQSRIVSSSRDIQFIAQDIAQNGKGAPKIERIKFDNLPFNRKSIWPNFSKSKMESAFINFSKALKDNTSVTTLVLQNDEILKLDSDSKFIIISPSYEISTKEIILQNGTKINIE